LLVLIEYSNGIKFEEKEKIFIEKISNYSNDHTSWFNDIISLKKEKNDTYIFNLIKVYKINKNINEKEAIEEVYNMIKDITKKFIDIEKDIDDDKIKVYYDSLGYFMVGHMKWCIESNRYF
jgi:hypothetical protein